VEHLVGLVIGVIVGLFSLLVAAIAAIEHAARVALGEVGVTGEIQTALLALLLLGLIVVSLRLFGRLFGVLIGVVLVLALLHAVIAPHSSGGLASRPSVSM